MSTSKPLRQLKQPSTWTSGPASLRNLASGLRLSFLPPGAQLARDMGASMRTGCTEAEMARGLDLCGLNHERQDLAGATDDDAMRELRFNMRQRGMVVLMRTQLDDAAQWVLLRDLRHLGDNVEMVCPSRSILCPSIDELIADWRSYGFEHILVPAALSAHPIASQREREARLSRRQAVHEMTAEAFLGRWPVIPNSELRRFHHDMLAATRNQLLHRADHPDQQELEIHVDAHPDVRFSILSGNGGMDSLLLTDRQTGVMMGGITQGTHWLEPQFRGRGLGAEMVLVAFDNPQFRLDRPISYSEDGYRSRLNVHAIACERARVLTSSLSPV